MRSFFIFLVLSGILCSCEEYKISGTIFQDESLINELYSKSSDTISLQNQHYIFTIELYRDFSPGVLPKANPLTAYSNLYELDSLTIVSNLNVKHIFAIHENTIWKSTPEKDDKPYFQDYEQKFVIRNGPEWDTGIFVDVIMEIEALQIPYFLISRNNLIQRIE